MTTFIHRIFTDDMNPIRELADMLLMEREILKAQRIAEANADTFDRLPEKFFALVEHIEEGQRTAADSVNFADEVEDITDLQAQVDKEARRGPFWLDAEPFVDDWSLPGYDYHTGGMRDELRDAGYGDFGPY